MSLAVSITLDASKVIADLKAHAAAMNDRKGLHGSISTGVLVAVKSHLRTNYLPRDGPRGDFWADVIASAQASHDATAATVSLTELGIGLRYYGGDVTPGKSISSFTGELTRTLAVPSAAVPVKGGRQVRPGRAGVLAFIHGKRGGETVGYLVEGVRKTAKKGKNKGKPYIIPKPGGALLYTLRTITRHKGDTKILPTEQVIFSAAMKATQDFIRSFIA